jgi:hypothetical protein
LGVAGDSMNMDRVAFLVAFTLFFGLVALKPFVVFRRLSLGKANFGGVPKIVREGTEPNSDVSSSDARANQARAEL